MPDLSEPFQYQFMVRAIIAATIVGGLCGGVGVFIVLRRLSYIGHGLAHSIFGGAVVSYVVGINFYIGATIWGATTAFLINVLGRQRKIGGDAAIGVITTSAFALGVALISQQRRFTRDFEAALFGEILGVTQLDLYVVYGATIGVAIVVFLFWKQLLFTTFDADVARAYDVPVIRVELIFSVILAATVIASLQVLGATLIAAAIVIPPVIARLLTDSFARLVLLAAIIGSASGFAGAYISWFVDVSSGATIVLVQASLFLAALGYTLVRSHFFAGSAGAERIAGLEHAVYD